MCKRALSGDIWYKQWSKRVGLPLVSAGVSKCHIVARLFPRWHFSFSKIYSRINWMAPNSNIPLRTKNTFVDNFVLLSIVQIKKQYSSRQYCWWSEIKLIFYVRKKGMIVYQSRDLVRNNIFILFVFCTKKKDYFYFFHFIFMQYKICLKNCLRMYLNPNNDFLKCSLVWRNLTHRKWANHLEM